MTSDLRGKNAIVTGAASGIGLATANALVDAGARVVGYDIQTSPLARFPLVGVDITDAHRVREVMHAPDSFDRIDVLVNSAGLEIQSTLADLDMAVFEKMYRVNVGGTVIVTQSALSKLTDAARVINLASELAYLGRAGSSAYSATKGAVLSLTRSWARELGPRILVNAVAPGPIDTPLLSFATMSPELQTLETSNPLKRIGRPEEVAAMIVFLAGPGATFTTGQCFAVDGGAAMR
jgi:3-oxoacyl-[acyl-carrier protein] reductase